MMLPKVALYLMLIPLLLVACSRTAEPEASVQEPLVEQGEDESSQAIAEEKPVQALEAQAPASRSTAAKAPASPLPAASSPQSSPARPAPAYTPPSAAPQAARSPEARVEPDPIPTVSRNEPEIVPSAPRPMPVESAELPPPPPPPPPRQPVYVTVPEGSAIQVRLMESLSSQRSESGQNFQAVLDRDLTWDDVVAIRAGTAVTGRIEEAVESGRVRGRARLALVLTEIRDGSETYPIRTNTIAVEADGSEGRDAKVIGGAAGVGAIVGAIAGGKRGAAIGAAIGGSAGTGAVLVTRGKEVEFDIEQRFSFRLDHDLRVRLTD